MIRLEVNSGCSPVEAPHDECHSERPIALLRTTSHLLRPLFYIYSSYIQLNRLNRADQSLLHTRRLKRLWGLLKITDCTSPRTASSRPSLGTTLFRHADRSGHPSGPWPDVKQAAGEEVVVQRVGVSQYRSMALWVGVDQASMRWTELMTV
jgi:hypothetical protein